MSDELTDLAQEYERRHAALIDEANSDLTMDGRRAVRDRLDQLRQEFTERALSITGVDAPYLWRPENPDHAVALAVRNDIADTEMRLAQLAYNQQLFKTIRELRPDLNGPPRLPNLDKILMVVAVILVGYAILAGRR
jgi:hypothetical protein